MIAITVKAGDKEIQLTIDEAKQLMIDLQKVFGALPANLQGFADALMSAPLSGAGVTYNSPAGAPPNVWCTISNTIDNDVSYRQPIDKAVIRSGYLQVVEEMKPCSTTTIAKSLS